MNHFENEKGSFEYSIKKSNRKTVSIIVETDSSVRVLAPNKMHQSAIDALLDKKLEWIMVHLEKMSRHQVDALIFVSGECIHYLGAPLNLKIMEVKSKRDQKVIVSGHQLFVYTPNEAPDYVKNLMMIWFRLRSEEVITERVAFYEQQMGTIPAKVVVKTQSKRWGSCNSKRHIFLNWRLIFAPIEVIDYVIIHELCHLVHMNHSAHFWQLVEKHDSKYKAHRAWLKENGQRLFQL